MRVKYFLFFFLAKIRNIIRGITKFMSLMIMLRLLRFSSKTNPKFLTNLTKQQRNLSMQDMKEILQNQKNVLGAPLKICSTDPMTGYTRDGKCTCITSDPGQHTVAAVMTEEFLNYTKSVGNDLSTPIPQFRFPGLKPGDRWCLCLSRWIQAVQAEKGPKVILEATNESVLEHVDLEILKEYQFKDE